MSRKRKLTCVELRVHLCDTAVKNTQLCVHCTHPCQTGIEYRERFLGVKTAETAERERIREEERVGMLVDTYTCYMVKGTHLTDLLPKTRPYGIRKTRTLQDEWKKNMPLMETYCQMHGMKLPDVNVAKLIRGRISYEQRMKLYRQRLDEYKLMIQSGYSYAEMADYYQITEAAIRKRIIVAKKAVAADDERIKFKEAVANAD